jgi:hypothetical protein
MVRKTAKYSSSQYKYIKKCEWNDKVYWQLNYPNVSMKGYDTEREAAIAIDKILISKGKEPVNILVRK